MKKTTSVVLALLMGGFVSTSACDMAENEFSSDEQVSSSDQLLEDQGPYSLYIEETFSLPGSASNRKVQATLCAPGNADGTAIADGTYPLILTAPGATQSRAQYRSYCEHLGSWGFVVISKNIIGNSGFFPPANHKLPAADMSAMIDFLLSDDSGLADSIDAERIGVAGHSMGGKVAMLTAANDARIGAVVGWDPVDSNGPFTSSNSPDYSSVTPELMPEMAAAVAVIGETTNRSGSWFSPACAPAAENFQQYYEFAETPSLEVEIIDADHMDFTDSANCWPCSPCGRADADFVKAISRRVTVAWFRRHLQGDTTMDELLTLGDEVAGGLVTVQSK
ncbi:MAG: hypothetical protein AAGC55_10755 [Myxococcota bacterium]